MYKLFRKLIWVLLISVTFFSIDAFASSDTGVYPKRGEGLGRINGYAVSNLEFRFAEDPSYLSAVEIDLDAPAKQVMVGFENGSSQAFSCINTDQLHWVCSVKNVKLSLIESLRVFAIG